MSDINYPLPLQCFHASCILNSKRQQNKTKKSPQQKNKYKPPHPGNPSKSSEHYRTRDSMSIRSFSNVLAYSDKLSISRVFCKVGTSSSTSGSQRSSPEVVIEEPKELVSSAISKKTAQKQNHII